MRKGSNYTFFSFPYVEWDITLKNWGRNHLSSLSQAKTLSVSILFCFTKLHWFTLAPIPQCKTILCSKILWCKCHLIILCFLQFYHRVLLQVKCRRLWQTSAFTRTIRKKIWIHFKFLCFSTLETYDWKESEAFQRGTGPSWVSRDPGLLFPQEHLPSCCRKNLVG